MKLLGSICIVVALGLGCAGTPRQQDVTTSTGPRWSGSLQQTQSRTGMTAPTAMQRATGTILLIPLESGRARVSLSVSAPAQSTSQLRWAVLSGPCGSRSFPLIGFNQFPLLEVGGDGRAQLSIDLPLELQEGGQYHVNVYTGQGQQLEHVLTCGTLRRDG